MTYLTAATTNGPGTFIQQSKYDGVFIPTTGGHIKEIPVVGIAPLIAKLLGFDFRTPDGKMVEGIMP